MQLKPFQIEGATFLAGRTRALLADEPGVGKTAQVVTACDAIGARRTLVVCPGIGLEHWRREFKRWSSSTSHRDVISYDAARKFKPTARYDVLVVDECHQVKNPAAQRTKAVLGKSGLAWHADRIWCLSGTPAPNNVAELWTLLRAFNKTAMDHETFTRYFCYVDDQGKIRGNRADRVAELRGIVETFTLRRKKKDVLPELGEINIAEWYVKPDAAFVNAHWHQFLPTFGYIADETKLREALADKSDEDLLAFLAGDQEFSTLRRYNALLKAPAVFETVKFEIENELLDKIVIYGYHKEALAALQNAFLRAGIDAVLIYGDTPLRERDGMIEKWKREKQTPVLLASITIASTVLDFSVAHQGIMIELGWVPGDNSQAIQRMHRHGQENPVTVRVAIGTPIDEIVSDVLLRKTRDLAEVFD